MAQEEGQFPNSRTATARDVAFAAAILLLGLFAYSNSLSGEFVYDDLRMIRDNPVMRSLGPFFTGDLLKDRRHLGLLSFALNFHWGGLVTTGYHATNLAIHLASALLVYTLVHLTFRSPRLAGSSLAPQSRAVGFVAAALFVAHPIQTQAVSYVVQRLASLATFFCLASLVLYAAWRLGRESGRRGGARQTVLLILAVLADIAAMRTKEISIALPFGILLYEACFFDGPWRRRLWYVAPFALTLPIIPYSYLSGPKPLPTPDQPTPLGHADYLITQVAVTAEYIRMLFVPTGQALDHFFPVYRSILAPKVLFSSAVLLLIALLAAFPFLPARWKLAPRLDPAARIASFGVAWFFLGLAPQSTFIPNPDLLMEHRLYLPSVGAALAVTTWLGLVIRRIPGVPASRTIILAGLPVSLLLATATMNRNEAWRSELTIWRDSAEKTPSTSRSHANLGTLLVRGKNSEEGLEELRRAVAIAPEWAWPRAQLGAALLQLGKVSESESALRQALALNPDDPEASFNLGMLLARTGRRAESRPYFEKFLEIAPPGYEAARRAASGFLSR
jgi:tetratricopeptide (TPR) repeat protein